MDANAGLKRQIGAVAMVATASSICGASAAMRSA